MAVKHAFESAVPDGGDASLVQPSNWNADHTIDDGTLVAAKLSATETDVLFGRDTAGAGNGEEIPFATFLTPAQGDAAYDALGSAAAAEAASQPLDADLTSWAGVTRGTGFDAAAAVNVGSAGAVVVNGGALGTPSSGTLTNCTGLPVAGGGTGSTTAQGARGNLATQFVLTPPGNKSVVSPGDGGVYVSGAYDLLISGGFDTLNAIYVKQACIIREARLVVAVAGTNGSAETATWYVRVNNTTDTQVSNSVVFNGGTTPARFDNTSLNLSLAAGDYFFAKIVMPTFATNPTTVVLAFSFTLE